jgi:hypothetical protein
VLERAAAGLPTVLAPRGIALVVLSTDGDGSKLLAAFASHGLQSEPVASRDYGNEVVTVYAVRSRT